MDRNTDFPAATAHDKTGAAAHGAQPAATVSRRSVLIIHNPTAGWRHVYIFRNILRRLREAGCEPVVRETAAAGDARRFAEEAAREGGYDAIVAAGGDGTINEVINGLTSQEGALTIPLGIVPLGTANVLAHEIGLRRRSKAIARTLVFGPVQPIHLGIADGTEGRRAFSMMLSGGFDSQVVAHMRSGWKKLVGKFAYVTRGTIEWVKNRPNHITAVVDGIRYSSANVIVAKGRSYAGPFVAAHKANIATPSLQIIVAERPGRWNMLRYMYGIVTGRLPHFPDVRVLEAKSLRLEGGSNQPIQVDGDTAGTLPVSIEISRHPVPLIMPA
jgi:diacylglycerol kinase (ATP)